MESRNFYQHTPVFFHHPLTLPLLFALKAFIKIEAVSSAALVMLAMFVPTGIWPGILFFPSHNRQTSSCKIDFFLQIGNCIFVGLLALALEFTAGSYKDRT